MELQVEVLFTSPLVQDFTVQRNQQSAHNNDIQNIIGLGQ